MKGQGSTAHFLLANARLNYAPCREEVLGAPHPNPMAMHMSTAPINLGTTTTINNNINDNNNDNNDDNDTNADTNNNGNTHDQPTNIGEAAQPC